MIKILFLIFFILLITIAKMKGFKTFICFIINYILIVSYIFLIQFNINAIVFAIITCLLSAIISLFLINGNNIKTQSSFISICLVLILMFLGIYVVAGNANIQGFSYESIETISNFSFEISSNMNEVIIGVFLICLIGTIIDTSMAISTALNEIYLNNLYMSFKDLYLSGMNIGKDILNTTINTLFFVFLGGMIGLFFFHASENFTSIINNKAITQEIINLLFCCIGSILVIPITSFVTSSKIIKLKKKIS